MQAIYTPHARGQRFLLDTTLNSGSSDDQTKGDSHLETLLARCALRDQAAFKALYDEVAAKLNGIAIRITGSRDIAEDVLQVSFTQIWNDCKTYRPDIARPMTWMTSIVRHRSLDRLKADQRRVRVIDDSIELEINELASREKGPMEHFVLEQTRDDLSECMERLSESQQRSVMLAYYYGLSREEIATKLDTAAGTVKSWLHRGLKRLEECLAL
ncbi:MAG: RNA polymerase sigma factor [Halioglobus sp.]